MDIVDSLETGCKRAVEILRENASGDGVKQATDLIQSELQHLLKVTSSIDKNPVAKVSKQTKLDFVCLGKTKKSDEIILPVYIQRKMTEFFQKSKSVKRKLIISSDSEGVSEKITDKEDDESPLDECPSLGDESSHVENETVLASGPMNPPSPPTTNVS